MVALNAEHSCKQPLQFALELIRFFGVNNDKFKSTQRNKENFNFLMMNQNRNRNFRTLPCKAYHAMPVENGPANPQSYCHRGHMCNFIHADEFKGSEIPREDFYRIRGENQQRFQLLLYTLNPSLV